MAVAISFRFPLGEYHATAWDKSVNSGAPEWPPSPWRILRTLLSTWHTRCPHLEESVVESLLHDLAQQPPVYRLPEVTYSETRHYMPLMKHRTAESGETAKTLAPRYQVNPRAELVVTWSDVELGDAESRALAEIVDVIPYLGRSESICEAEVIDALQVSFDDADLTVPVDRNESDTLSLVPVIDVTRAQLEGTPDRMRAARRLTPEGARWQGYRLAVPDKSVSSRARTRSGVEQPTAIRWSIDASHLMRFAEGVTATSALRSAVLASLGRRGLERPGAELVSGPHDASHARHDHAHWLWLGDRDDEARPWEDAFTTAVKQVALWVPGGIDADLLGDLLRVRQLPRLPYTPKGYVPGKLNLQALGSVEAVLGELVSVRDGRASRRWRSVTPMLTERHLKGRYDGDVERRRAFVVNEIERELSYRTWRDGRLANGDPSRVVPTGVKVMGAKFWDEPAVVKFRRYRNKENMADRRRGFFLEFELDTPVLGPMSIGALSHFGFGRFTPSR